MFKDATPKQIAIVQQILKAHPSLIDEDKNMMQTLG